MRVKIPQHEYTVWEIFKYENVPGGRYWLWNRDYPRAIEAMEEDILPI